MAKLKKEDLEFLTDAQIKEILSTKDVTKYPTLIKEFILDADNGYEARMRIDRVNRLLDNLIVDRFLKPLKSFSPDCKPINTVGDLKAILNTFDDGDIIVLEATDKNGDVQDLYQFYVDVIEGMELTTGGTREIRFTQIQHQIQ